MLKIKEGRTSNFMKKKASNCELSIIKPKKDKRKKRELKNTKTHISVKKIPHTSSIGKNVMLYSTKNSKRQKNNNNYFEKRKNSEINRKYKEADHSTNKKVSLKNIFGDSGAKKQEQTGLKGTGLKTKLKDMCVFRNKTSNQSGNQKPQRKKYGYLNQPMLTKTKNNLSNKSMNTSFRSDHYLQKSLIQSSALISNKRSSNNPTNKLQDDSFSKTYNQQGLTKLRKDSNAIRVLTRNTSKIKKKKSKRKLFTNMACFTKKRKVADFNTSMDAGIRRTRKNRGFQYSRMFSPKRQEYYRKPDEMMLDADYYMENLNKALCGDYDQRKNPFFIHYYHNFNSLKKRKQDILAKYNCNEHNLKAYIAPTLARSAPKKRTLLFDLDETLVHCKLINNAAPESMFKNTLRLVITLPNGDKMKAQVNIRPGTKELLQSMSKIYEVGIFTAAHQYYAKEVIKFLDPNRDIIKLVLTRKNCVEVGHGLYVKDLRVVKGRDVKQMLIVDNFIHSYALNLPNGIPCIPFTDNPDDEELGKLSTYLTLLNKQKDFLKVNEKYFKSQKLMDFDDFKTLMAANNLIDY